MGWLSRIKWCLLGCVIVVLLLAGGSVFIPGRLTNAVTWMADNDFAHRLRALSEQEAYQKSTFTEMVVETVGVSEVGFQPVVVLKDIAGELYLPIWIGPLEANAISVVLDEVEVPRPLTSDLLSSIINRMGGRVDYIVINDIKDNTFYSSIALDANWRKMEIDARPSDAIAVALRVGAPIYVEKAVLDKAGIRPDRRTDKYTIMHVERDGRELAYYVPSQ